MSDVSYGTVVLGCRTANEHKWGLVVQGGRRHKISTKGR